MLHTIIETLTLFVLNTIDTLGYAGVFVLMALESANIPIPSEIIMPFSGFLVVQGDFIFWVVVLMGALGNLAGSLVSYYLARYYGTAPLHFLSKFYLVHMSHIELAERWFQKYGNFSAFIARFVPIVRTFISYPAGMFRVNVWYFSLLTFVGSFGWSWLLTYIGFKLGERWMDIEGYFRNAQYLIAAVIIGVAVWWAWGVYKEHKKGI